MKLPFISGQKMIKILYLKGFRPVRQRSSHVQLKDSLGRLVTVPVHANKPVSIGIVIKILRDAEISREEFFELEEQV